MVAGSARNWIAVHAVNNPTSTKLTTKNMTTLPLGNSISRRPLRRSLLFIPLVLCGFALAQPQRADATTTTWTGTSGDWFSGTNWSNGVPNSSKDALINNGGKAAITSSGAAAHSLILGQYYQDSGEVDAGTSADLNVSSAIYVGSLGTGTLNISNGATVESITGYIAASAVAPASNGSVTVTGSNSTWNVGRINFLSSRLFVSGNENGDGGTGLLSITNGGAVLVTNNNNYASVTVGSSGTLTGNGTLATTSEPTVVVKGTLAPSSGTLSVGGSLSTSNLILFNTATTACDVTPQDAPTTPQVDISGTALLDGRLSVTMTGTFTCATTRYTLLHSAGVLNGTFQSVSINYPTNQGFTPHITYDYVGNRVYLDLVFNHPCG